MASSASSGSHPARNQPLKCRQQLDQRLAIWTFLTLHPVGHGAGVNLKDVSQLLLAAVGAEEPILQSDAEARIGGRRGRPRPRGGLRCRLRSQFLDPCRWILTPCGANCGMIPYMCRNAQGMESRGFAQQPVSCRRSYGSVAQGAFIA